MFIIKDEDGGLVVHLDGADVVESVRVGLNVRVTLTPDKAKELEDRLEEILKVGK